jgi:aminoglycoside phosphotransferase (APT) family kinase protein
LEYLQVSGILDAALIADIAELLRFYEKDEVALRVNCLLHGDLTMEHVWVDVARCDVTAIVDFGDATIGDPVWDFVYFDWQKPDLLRWILNGYTSPSSLGDSFQSRLLLYRLVYTMSVLVWAHARKGIELSGFIDSLGRYVRNAKAAV